MRRSFIQAVLSVTGVVLFVGCSGDSTARGPGLGEDGSAIVLPSQSSSDSDTGVPPCPGLSQITETAVLPGGWVTTHFIGDSASSIVDEIASLQLVSTTDVSNVLDMEKVATGEDTLVAKIPAVPAEDTFQIKFFGDTLCGTFLSDDVVRVSLPTSVTFGNSLSKLPLLANGFGTTLGIDLLAGGLSVLIGTEGYKILKGDFVNEEHPWPTALDTSALIDFDALGDCAVVSVPDSVSSSSEVIHVCDGTTQETCPLSLDREVLAMFPNGEGFIAGEEGTFEKVTLPGCSSDAIVLPDSVGGTSCGSAKGVYPLSDSSTAFILRERCLFLVSGASVVDSSAISETAHSCRLSNNEDRIYCLRGDSILTLEERVVESVTFGNATVQTSLPSSAGTGSDLPTDMEVAPDGTVYLVKDGTLTSVNDGTVSQTTGLDRSIKEFNIVADPNRTRLNFVTKESRDLLYLLNTGGGSGESGSGGSGESEEEEDTPPAGVAAVNGKSQGHTITIDDNWDSSESFTVEAWLYIESEGWGESGTIRAIGQWGSSEVTVDPYAWQIKVLSGGSLQVELSSDGESSAGHFAGPSTATWNVGEDRSDPNDWNHVAFVFDQPAGLVRICLNGVCSEESSDVGGHDLTGIADTHSDLIIGISGDLNEPGDLLIDELRISDSVRYDSTTYSVPTTPFTTDSNTVGLYHFNSSSVSGETVTSPDSSEDTGAADAVFNGGASIDTSASAFAP